MGFRRELFVLFVYVVGAPLLTLPTVVANDEAVIRSPHAYVVTHFSALFLTAADPDYTVLSMWVNGAKEDPSCVEPGSDQ